MSFFAYSFDQISQIFDSANERGQIRKSWLKLNDYDVDVLFTQNTSEISDLRHKIREEKKREEIDENKIVEIEEELQAKQESKEYIEKEIKEDIFKKILSKEFKIKIDKKYHKDTGKYIYVTGDDRDSFFACKIIHDELQKTYKINQPDRNVILKNVKLLLSDCVDKMIVRGDLKSFFESVPRECLLSKIIKDGIICHRSIKLMKRMFYQLSNEFEYKGGVPRGISFSPSLADIYLRDIDNKISNLEGVYLYQRYVDDVIIIASPTLRFPNAKSLFMAVERTFADGKLILHTEDDSEKYLAEDIHYNTIGKLEFDYLGYHISLNKLSGEVTFRLTQRKMVTYRSQIEKIANFYLHTATHNPRKDKTKGQTVNRHRQSLYRFKKLLGYLTCNYHLGGAKGNILSGIYYKHTLLTDTSQLRELDKALGDMLNACVTPSVLDDRLKSTSGMASKLKYNLLRKYSFEKGFSKRRMCHMTSADFKMIKHILQYEEAEN